MTEYLELRVATEDEHKEISKIFNQSPYTSAFTNRMMFSSHSAYEKGWIRVATVGGVIVGCTCVRHKVREPKTMLYFITIDQDQKTKGIGRMLLDNIMDNSPHKLMELNVAKDNKEAISFYVRLGFVTVGEGLKGEAWRLEKEWS